MLSSSARISVEGGSFLPIARGETCRWRNYLHGEHILFEQRLHWLTDGREKYVWLSGFGCEQLFNLDDDPQELHNLARRPSSRGRVEYWRRLLIKALAGREEGFTDGKRLIPGRPVKACLSHVLRRGKPGRPRRRK